MCIEPSSMHLMPITSTKLNHSSAPLTLPNPAQLKCCHARRNTKSVLWDSFCLRKHEKLFSVRSELSSEKDDSFYMRRCIRVAKRALGCTSPNPLVGCVIVKDGKIVGEGFHPKAGLPHAEVFALKDAGHMAENSTAFVSLEPCNHYGRTPPCTEALIHARVKRVVVGMVDPNPIVASRGVERLKEAGIEVTVGVEEELCRKLNEAYIHRMLTGKPLATLRYSISINGQFQGQLGYGAEDFGGYYSKLLEEYDAVMIPSSFLAETSTYPKSQEIGASQPVQIIVATPSESPLYIRNAVANGSIVFKHKDVIVHPETESNLSQLGLETVVLDQMDLGLMLDYCGRRGLCSILIDQRGYSSDFAKIIENGLEEELLQKVVVEVLPYIDRNHKNSGMRLKVGHRDSIRLNGLESRTSNGSILLEGYIC